MCVVNLAVGCWVGWDARAFIGWGGCACIPRSCSCDETVELFRIICGVGRGMFVALGGCGARWVAALRVPKSAQQVDESGTR